MNIKACRIALQNLSQHRRLPHGVLLALQECVDLAEQVPGEVPQALLDQHTIDNWAASNPLDPVPVATPYHNGQGRGSVLWRIEIGDYCARSYPSADAVRHAAAEHIQAQAEREQAERGAPLEGEPVRLEN